MGSNVVWFPWEAATRDGVSAAGPSARVETLGGELDRSESGSSGDSSDSESDSEDGANSVVDNCGGSE